MPMRNRLLALALAVLAAGIPAAFPRAAAADAAGSIAVKPLAPRAFPRGKTMFVKLSPEQTGVRTENPYDDPRMWGELYQEFEVGSIGSGVAIGDYDGDGRPDIFVVNKTGRCRLFRNLGGYRFEDVTDRAGIVGTDDGAWNGGVTFVDINNSGLLDIYLCRFIVTNLLSISKQQAGQKDYLLLNNRNGTFTDVTERAGISGEGQGHSATWWDFDDDGWPDLYVANDFGTPDKLYRNNRDG